jgi:hypothetical protein
LIDSRVLSPVDAGKRAAERRARVQRIGEDPARREGDAHLAALFAADGSYGSLDAGRRPGPSGTDHAGDSRTGPSRRGRWYASGFAGAFGDATPTAERIGDALEAYLAP